MNWELLLFLACPLMMLFCMKGMFSGSKDKNSKKSSQSQTSQQSEMESIQLKMTELMKQNDQLMREVKSLKESSINDANVIELEKKQAK